MRRRSTFFLRAVFLCFLTLLTFLGLRESTSRHSSENYGALVKSPLLPSEQSEANKTAEGIRNASSLEANPSSKEINSTLLKIAPSYIEAILNPEDISFPRLQCPSLSDGRYEYLYHKEAETTASSQLLKYFFTLDLHQCAKVLPRLLGSIVETMRFLGPENCALSVVEGRSDDGTFEILNLLRPEFEKLGVKYFFNRTDANPWLDERIKILAELRNLALKPLLDHTDLFSADATVIFLNDVALCMEDILELIHQRFYQDADMTCAMDWTYVGRDPTFYDVWIARGMNGDSFFDIPEDGNWNSAWNLFWNNQNSLQRYNTHKPFQVFSCWNGATAFTAKPLVENKIRFRASSKDECFQGEPQLFCKDMWYQGYGKIAVIPAINIEYSDERAKQIKELKGYVSEWVAQEGNSTNGPSAKIEWEASPPALIRCMAKYANQTWRPWNESLT